MLKMCHTMNSLEQDNMFSFNSPTIYNDENLFYLNSIMNTEYYDKITICNVIYKTGFYIVTNISKYEKEFGEILTIIKIYNEVFFYVKIYIEKDFDEDCFAYSVGKKKAKNELFNYKDLPDVPPCLTVIKNNVRYVSVKHIL